MNLIISIFSGKLVCFPVKIRRGRTVFLNPSLKDSQEAPHWPAHAVPFHILSTRSAFPVYCWNRLSSSPLSPWSKQSRENSVYGLTASIPAFQELLSANEGHGGQKGFHGRTEELSTGGDSRDRCCRCTAPRPIPAGGEGAGRASHTPAPGTFAVADANQRVRRDFSLKY